MSRGGTVPVPGTNVTGGVRPPAGGAVNGPIGKTIGGATVRGGAGAGIAGGALGRCDGCVCCGAGAPAPPCAGRWALRPVVSKRMKGISAVRIRGSQAWVRLYATLATTLRFDRLCRKGQPQFLAGTPAGERVREIGKMRRDFAEEVCRRADFLRKPMSHGARAVKNARYRSCAGCGRLPTWPHLLPRSRRPLRCRSNRVR